MLLPKLSGYHALAIFSLFHVAMSQLSRTGWTVTADSYQVGNEVSNVLDGNSSTFWHSQYSPSVPLPHYILLDMKQTYNVSGTSYLPRQDGNSNGNIGQHKIELSLDGVNWGSPAAIGAYLDDNSVKVTSFVTRQAQYVRITATTEAGNRGPWTSMAELNIYGTTSYTPPPPSGGKWEYTLDIPIVPAAGALIGTAGKVLFWSSYTPSTFSGTTSNMTVTATYDPTSGTVSQRTVTNTQHDMFCPGISVDANGRPIVTGGNAAPKTSIYDPTSDAWISAANMQIPRGYQASATCSDGRVFTIGGSWSGGTGNKNGEIYSTSADAWSLLPGCPVAPMLTNDAQGVYRADNHGWLFGWKNGYVFQAGPSVAMNWYGTSGNGSQTSAGTRGSDTDAMCGNAVMYDAVAGTILSAGGSPSYQYSDATTNANIITINSPDSPASVQQVASMTYPRAFANGVVLPDGKVLITGGQTYPIPFSDANSTFIPELWDPVTQTFTMMNPHAIPRNYHSIALLQLDGTVINGGGGLCGNCATNHFDAEIFSPPYLFNGDGSRATRPVIESLSTTSVGLGASITVSMDSAVTAFSLIRQGSATHTVDTDQRRIPLTPTSTGTNTYSVTIPGDAGVALPGYWMLFAVNAAGVPSVANVVQVHP